MFAAFSITIPRTGSLNASNLRRILPQWEPNADAETSIAGRR
jgi:hypothetical protein